MHHVRARRPQHEFVDELATRPSVLGSLALAFTCSLKCDLLLCQQLRPLADVGDIIDLHDNGLPPHSWDHRSPVGAITRDGN